ncbi:MAG: glycosyltransferase, partial [Microbacteriaceae bacterium]
VERPVAVVPNPVPPAGRAPVPLPAGPPRFLWVARCEPEKRPLVFADAVLAARARTDAAFGVDVVGEGSQLRELRARLAGLESVRVHGGQPHERVLELIDAAAIVVLTSLGFDNQPMTIAEAVSRHRGVLYCDPALAEGLRHCGVLAAGPGAAELGAAIAGLAADPRRLGRIAEAAERDATEFGPARFVERIEAVYARAAAEAKTR